MKKKRKIETIDDIKYCEENGLTIYSYTWEPDFFIFANGVWCMCSDNELKIYNNTFDISYDELYYYEKEKECEEPVHEVTEDDLGCLCYCWDEENDEEELGILKDYDKSDKDKYHIDGLGYYKHCRKLSPSEVAELTGYKVEESE